MAQTTLFTRRRSINVSPKMGRQISAISQASELIALCVLKGADFFCSRPDAAHRLRRGSRLHPGLELRQREILLRRRDRSQGAAARHARQERADRRGHHRQRPLDERSPPLHQARSRRARRRASATFLDKPAARRWSSRPTTSASPSTRSSSSATASTSPRSTGTSPKIQVLPNR